MAREMGTIVYKRPAKRVAEIVEDTWGGPRSDRGRRERDSLSCHSSVTENISGERMPE